MYSCWEREHLWQDVNQLQWCSLSEGPRLHRQSHELSPHCSLGLREICPIRLCSDGGWNSVSEDCNHRATPVNPYWSQELTQAGFLFRQLHLMVILIILQGIAVPGTLTGILQFQSPLPVHSLLRLWSTTVFHDRPPLHLYPTSARSRSSDEMTDIIGLAPNRKPRAFPAHAGVCLCCQFSIHRWGYLLLPRGSGFTWLSDAAAFPSSSFGWGYLGVGLVGQRSACLTENLCRGLSQFTVSPRVTCSASLSSFGIVRF